jgi:hypothetical protein
LYSHSTFPDNWKFFSQPFFGHKPLHFFTFHHIFCLATTTLFLAALVFPLEVDQILSGVFFLLFGEGMGELEQYWACRSGFFFFSLPF